MAIGKDDFVISDAHPEYGLGRVLAADAFSTRVLFKDGGVRVVRAADVGKLRVVDKPATHDVEMLEAKEALVAQGVHDRMPPKKDEPPPPKARTALRRK